MKWLVSLLPYLLIALVYTFFLLRFHPEIFKYQFDPFLLHNYLRSQDIEDSAGIIHDRVFLSDSDIYIATGVLYATGSDPTTYNFQHPPLIKYLFGISTLLTGNPFWVQIFFGLALLCLTYFLGEKLGLGKLGYLGVLGLLVDPVFGGMMNQAFLDLGQAVFALAYIILEFFFPESYILQGIALGLFAASKFWSTAIIFIIIVFFYRIYIRKEKINWKKTAISFTTAFVVFCLAYMRSFAGGNFNIFSFLAKDFKFMISHNSASSYFGPIILFLTGYFAPWWRGGVAKALDWSFLWPVGLAVGVFEGIREFREKAKNYNFFFYFFPLLYLLLESTQVPFTRYFIIILPYVYLGLARIFASF